MAKHYLLWKQALDEYPDNDEASIVARGLRYTELMREAGLIVPRKPGEPQALPCGWNPFTGPRRPSASRPTSDDTD